MQLHNVLLWIGAAIGISVGAAWAMMIEHNHEEYVQRIELNLLVGDISEMREDIRDMRNQLSDQLKLILEKVQRNGNGS